MIMVRKKWFLIFLIGVLFSCTTDVPPGPSFDEQPGPSGQGAPEVGMSVATKAFANGDLLSLKALAAHQDLGVEHQLFPEVRGQTEVGAADLEDAGVHGSRAAGAGCVAGLFPGASGHQCLPLRLGDPAGISTAVLRLGPPGRSKNGVGNIRPQLLCKSDRMVDFGASMIRGRGIGQAHTGW